jgi:hypothetical protein
VFAIFLEYFQMLRNSGKVKTDVQLLYVCFLLGPALHRIEKLDSSDAGVSIMKCLFSFYILRHLLTGKF